MAIFTRKRLPITWALRAFFFLLATVLLLCAGLIFIPWHNSTLNRLEKENLQHESWEIRQTVSTLLDHRSEALNDYTQLPQIRNALDRTQTSLQNLKSVMENLSLLGSNCQLVLIDLQGQIIHATHREPLFQYQDFAWFQAFSSGKSGRYRGISRFGEESFWQFAVPVVAEGVVRGILIAELPIEELLREAQLFNGLEDGQLEVLYDDQLVATFGQSNSTSTVMYHLAASEISLRLRSDRFNLEDSLQPLLLKFAIALLGLTFLLLLVAHRFNRSLIAQPIEQLRNLSKRLAAGEKSTATTVAHPLLEIALLAEDFNAMAEQIEQREQALIEARDSLELRVTERTKKLQKSEAALQMANENLEELVARRTQKIQQMQKQFAMQEKMASIGQLAAGIAHEINNPLNFVYTNFDTLEKNTADFRQLLKTYRELLTQLEQTGAEQQQTQQIRQQEAELNLDFILQDIEQLFRESRTGFERINWIVQSMRNFSRIDQAGDMARYDLNKGIADTLIIARNEYRDRAEIVTELGELPPLLCIPQQINQVFLALIINASQAITSQQRQLPGRIVIKSWYAEENIYIQVSDDGPGITPQLHSRIFEPFFTTKEAGKGTGLGLSISYDIVVHKHGGDLSVESNATGGASFCVRLPLR